MNKEELIKEIKNDLRTTKNKWVFKEYTLNGQIFETKRFNNWFQIFRYKDTKMEVVFPMYEKQKDVIQHIETHF